MSMGADIEIFRVAKKNLIIAFEQSKSSWKDEAEEQLRKMTLENIEGTHDGLVREMENLERLISQIKRQVK